MCRCRRCNRVLKAEPWRSKGIGKICEQKANREAKQTEADSDIIVPYDGGDIWIKRVEPERKTVSQLQTNVQRTIYRHSPTGFNYGYGGSGVADLALNILRMFAKQPDSIEPSVYQDFKWKYCAGEQGSELRIPRKTIIAYLKQHGVKTI